ncbi:MAG: protein rep [Flavobacteriales bacterium]|nr:protein rep [Flavobacteriales bacterium]
MDNHTQKPTSSISNNKKLINSKILLEDHNEAGTSALKISPLVRKERFSPFLGGEKSLSSHIPQGLKVNKNMENLKPISSPKWDLEKIKELDESFKNLTNKYINQNKARKILYEFEKVILDFDPSYAHLTELEKHYKAMNSHSTTKCMRVKSKNADNIGIRVDRKHDKAHYTGTVICGSPWACPVCASKIQTRRAIEIQEAFKWAYRDKKYQMMMVTLTFPHGIDDDLGDMLEKVKLAMVYFRKGENYDKFKKSIDYQGMIKATEITWGKINGWHPHTHELQIVKYDTDEKEQERIKAFILNQWEKACTKAGLLKHGSIMNFRKVAVDIIFHAKDSDYLAKLNHVEKAWGADKEMASATTKKGRATGFTPWQLLEQSDGNEQYRNLFLEYALRMKGKKQLVWSRGLKKKVGITEKTDEELAKEQTSESDLLALFTAEQWRIIIRNKDRAYIQYLAVSQGFEGLAKYFESYKSVLIEPDCLENIKENQRKNGIPLYSV